MAVPVPQVVIARRAGVSVRSVLRWWPTVRVALAKVGIDIFDVGGGRAFWAILDTEHPVQVADGWAFPLAALVVGGHGGAPPGWSVTDRVRSVVWWSWSTPDGVLSRNADVDGLAARAATTPGGWRRWVADMTARGYIRGRCFDPGPWTGGVAVSTAEYRAQDRHSRHLRADLQRCGRWGEQPAGTVPPPYPNLWTCTPLPSTTRPPYTVFHTTGIFPLSAPRRNKTWSQLQTPTPLPAASSTTWHPQTPPAAAFHHRIGPLPDPGQVLIVARTHPRPHRSHSPPLGMGRRRSRRFRNQPSKPQPDPADTPPRRLRLPHRRLLPGSLPITPPPHRPLRPRPLHPRTRPPPRRNPQHPNPPHTPTWAVTIKDAQAAVTAAALPNNVAALFERLLNRPAPNQSSRTVPPPSEPRHQPTSRTETPMTLTTTIQPAVRPGMPPHTTETKKPV